MSLVTDPERYSSNTLLLKKYSQKHCKKVLFSQYVCTSCIQRILIFQKQYFKAFRDHCQDLEIFGIFQYGFGNCGLQTGVAKYAYRTSTE